MSNIVNVSDAVEVIVDKLKTNGLKSNKLRNYGYYSFSVKNISYKEIIESAFEYDSRFELIVKKSYLEYIIKSNDLDLEFKLNYESLKQNSKLILSLNI